MDPVASRGMTTKREQQARLAAISVLRSYGKAGAIRRAKDMGEGVRDLNPGNKAFFSKIETLIREGIDHDTIDGERMIWRR